MSGTGFALWVGSYRRRTKWNRDGIVLGASAAQVMSATIHTDTGPIPAIFRTGSKRPPPALPETKIRKAKRKEIVPTTVVSPSQKLPETHSSKHAISESSTIYHLLYPDNKHTLCGFRVEQCDSECPTIAELHVVEFVPASRKLCKHCDMMDQRRRRPALAEAVE